MHDFLAFIGALFLACSAFALLPYLKRPRALFDEEPLQSEYVRIIGVSGLLVWFITGLVLCVWLASLALTLPSAWLRDAQRDAALARAVAAQGIMSPAQFDSAQRDAR